MYRNILFKGYSLEKNEPIEGFLFQTEVGYFIGPYLEEVQVYPTSIGQLIDKRDRNGKEIFEGDYIKDRIGNIFKIAYLPSASQFVALYQKGYKFIEIGDWCELAGDYFSNPKLFDDGE